MAKNDFSDLGFIPEENHDDLGFKPVDRQTASSEPVDPGLLNDLGRGMVQGVTFGFGDEIAGGLEAGADLLTGNTTLDKLKDAYQKHRDESRTLYKQAEERSPIASTVGNIAGGIAPALLTAGSSTAVQGAGALSRIAAGAKAGLGAGALGGLGTSEADTIAGDLSNAAEGAKMGALFGGAISGGVEAAKGVKGAAKKVGSFLNETTLAKDIKGAFNFGDEGQNLVTAKGLQSVEDTARKEGENLALNARSSLQKAGNKIKEATELADKMGINVNTSEGINMLKKYVADSVNSIDDRARDNAKKFQSIIDNIELGPAQPVNFSYTPIKAVKATPSSRSALEAEASKAKASAKALGQELKTEILESTDEAGNKILTLVKTSDENIGAAERAIPIKDADGNIISQDLDLGDGVNNKTTASAKSILDKPAVDAAIIPSDSGVVVNETRKIRMGGSDPAKLSLEQANEIKKVLNSQNGVAGAPNLTTDEAVNIAKSAAGSIDDALRENTMFADANDKYAAIKQAYKTLGLDADSFEKDAGTKLVRLTQQDQASLNNTIRRMAQDTQAGDNAAFKMTEALRLIGVADPELAATLRPQIERAANAMDLAQKAKGLGLQNKSTYIKSGSVYAANVAGLATNAARKSISNSTPESIKKLAQSLISSGSAAKMKLAQELGPIIQNKDVVSRNAAIFALQQNPEYRKMLNEHSEEDQK